MEHDRFYNLYYLMNKIIAKYLFLFIEILRREDVRKYLKQLERNQYLPKDELLKIQREKLYSLMQYVVNNNDYFKLKYERYDPFSSFDSLPSMTKDEIRTHYKEIATPKDKRKLDLIKTSGSTGMPLKLYRDRVVFGYNLAAVYRAHRWHGLDIGSKEAMLWGVPIGWKHKSIVRLRDFVLNRFREKEFNLGCETLMDFYKKIIKRKAEYIYSYSSMAYEFALFLNKKNMRDGVHNLKGVICTAETIHDYQKSLMEQVFGCKVISEYGATETGVISFECKEGRHHVSDDCVYIEAVDENNQPVPIGCPGKILVTVLNSFSFPIIRYELGDYIRMSNETCACGVNLSIIDEIIGRSNDIIVTPQGRCFHSIIIYYIMKEYLTKFDGISQFKVRQTEIDKLEFHIIKSEPYSEDAENWILRKIRTELGEEMQVKFLYHDSFERLSSGKLQDFESCLDTKKDLLVNFMDVTSQKKANRN